MAPLGSFVYAALAMSVLIGCGGRSPLFNGELEPAAAVAGAAGVTNPGGGGNSDNGGGTTGQPTPGGAGSPVAGAPAAGGASIDPDPDPEPDAPSSLAYYIDPANGDDANPGTDLLPFKTIEHAASLATDGDTIWFEDGSYGWQTEPAFRDDVTIRIADGVELRAVTAGAATLFSKVDNFGDGGFAFAGDTYIYGLHFLGFNPALRADHGDIVLDSVTFESPWDEQICNYGKHALIMLSGTAKMTMLLDDRSVLFSRGKCLVRLDDDATLDVNGGQLSGASWETYSSEVAVFSAWGRSQLRIDGLRVRNNQLPIIGAWDSAVVSLEHASMQGGAVEPGRAPPLIHVSDDASLRVEGTWFNGADLQCCLCAVVIENGQRAAANVVLKDVAMSHCKGAVSLHSDSDVRLENVTLSDNDAGLTVRGSTGDGSLEVLASHISSNDGHGIVIDAGTGTFSVSLRNTTVTQNGGDGIRLGRTPGFGGVARLDLGTLQERGWNDLHDNGRSLPGSVNLRIMDDVASDLFAVGNAWDLNTQGSDSVGEYYPYGFSAVYAADHQLLGTNYAFEGTASDTITLRLAERSGL
jgi:hypothetical protein